MFTHPTFNADGSFTLLQPMYTTLLIVSILLFLLILIPFTRKKFINGFTVITLSLFQMWLAIQLIYFDTILVEETGLGWNVISFFMVAAIVGFSFWNPFVYFKRKGKAKQKRF